MASYPNRSVEQQLLDCTFDWLTNLENNTNTDVIYFDLKKIAFDSVSHSKLIQKLASYNIKGPLLSWIQNFLSNRCQRVKIGQAFSEWTPVLSGVPQGSVLGPVLFLIFINDVCSTISTDCSIKLFADDIKIYIKNGLDQSSLQANINKIFNYCTSHQLSVNLSKVFVLHIGYNNPQYVYDINGHKITSVNEIRDLGVVIDSSLSFSTQTSLVYAKARKVACLILRTFISRDPRLLMNAFNTYVLPLLTFSSSVWFPKKKSDFNLIEKVLRKFTKAIDHSSSYESRLSSLNINSMFSRFNIHDLLTAQKILLNQTGLQPEKFFKFLSLARNSSKLSIPKLTERFKHFFCYRITDKYNSIPSDDKLSFTSFKTYCINNFYNNSTI